MNNPEDAVTEEIDYGKYFDKDSYECKWGITNTECMTCPVLLLSKRIIKLSGGEDSKTGAFVEQARNIIFKGKEKELHKKYDNFCCPPVIEWNNEVMQQKKLSAILS
jgi:hypothetical protein